MTARALPYLADVAALEWANHAVYHAADAAPLDAERLARVPEAEHERLRFSLHPATRLVASRYPILAIWQANQGDDPPAAEIDLDIGADYLLVVRRDFDLVIERLAPGEFALLSELATGAPLAQACEAAMAADAEIDLGAAMGRFVADGTLAEFHSF